MSLDGVLVLDFDGTVCLGDEPMLRYAHEVARVAGEAGPGIVQRVTEFLLDGDHREEPALARAQDGYQVAARLGWAAGASREDLQQAYQLSRVPLHAGEVAVHAPEGLAELLAELAGRIRIVLVTNAPDAGLHRVLDRLGLGGSFHEVHGDAGKPEGMTPILTGLLQQHGIADQPQRLLSIGDIWRNDLEPAQALGARTALVDRWGRGGGQPDARAATLEQLYPFIRDWARSTTG